jgi:hypothetical protein
MKLVALVVALGATLTLVQASPYVMMPDREHNRLVLFDANSGALVDSSLMALQGGTPVHALEVAGQIWVSEKTAGRVSRWSAAGQHLGNIDSGLDDVRGLFLTSDRVYVANGGTLNGAPGSALVAFDHAGNRLGHFLTGNNAPGPWSMVHFQYPQQQMFGMFVSSELGNDDIHFFGFGGTSFTTFHNSAGIQFVHQMAFNQFGSLLATGHDSNNIVRFATDLFGVGSGEIVWQIQVPNPRGLHVLGNGNLLWSNASGVWVYDFGTQSSQLVYSGDGGMFSPTAVPEPATLLAMAPALALLARRRKARESTPR